MDKTKWKSIMLPKQLDELLETFSKSELANSLGFTNKSQIAAVAIRDFLRNYTMYFTFLDFLDMNEKMVKLMDYNVGKVITVQINPDSRLLCVEHKSEHCQHTQFISEIPRFKDTIAKHYKKKKTFEPKKYSDDELLEVIRNMIGTSMINANDVSNKKLKKIIDVLED